MALVNALDALSTATKQDAGNASLASIDGKTPALVGGAVPVTISGGPTAAKQDTGNTSLASIDTKASSLATSAKQDAAATLAGALTETAPATDTASSGLNGRLQRIAQRLTALIALLPASLGIKTAAASLSVAPASDGVFVMAFAQATLTDRSGTIGTGGSQQTLMSSNSGRRGAWVQNNSTDDLWINTLANAVVGQPSLCIAPGVLYEFPSSGVPGTSISIIGASTGQAFSAREW